MQTSRASTRRAALAAFLLFAAGLLVIGPAEASRTTNAHSSLAPISAPSLASSSSRELASLELSPLEPADSASISSRLGFAEELGLLDVEARPCGFMLFGGVGTSRCELTYAVNNPLTYVDPDGREEMEAVLMANQRMQLRDMGGESAVQHFDRTNLALGGAAVAGLAGGAFAGDLALQAAVAFPMLTRVLTNISLDMSGASFAQRTYREAFSAGGAKALSESTGVAIKTVGDLAGALRSGAVKADAVTVNVIVRDGQTLILNTRTAQALERAGVPRNL